MELRGESVGDRALIEGKREEEEAVIQQISSFYLLWLLWGEWSIMRCSV